MSIPQLTGQPVISGFIDRCISTENIPHAIIINGPKEGGSFEIAYYFANLISKDPDIKVVDFPEKDPKYMETVCHEVVDTLLLVPYRNKRKVYIIQQADMMSSGAQNALLKSLEEPPEYAVIILLCSNSERLLPTIRSRTATLSMIPLSGEEISDYLISKESVSPDDASKISALCGGNIQKAISISKNPEYIQHIEDIGNIISRIILEKDSIPLDFKENLEDFSQNMDLFLDTLESFLRDVLVIKLANKRKLIYNGWKDNAGHIAAACDPEFLGEILCKVNYIKKIKHQNVNATGLLEMILFELN